MKKMFVLIAVVTVSQLIFAQEKQDTAINKARPGMFKKYHKGGRHADGAMMKELNLNEDQKKQLKEMMTAGKEKRDAILNDYKLTEQQKRDQLKELHEERAKNMQGILTEEQQTKMKAAKEKMKAERKNHPERKRHKKMPESKTTEIQPVQ